MIKHNTVERAVDTIINVVHEGNRAILVISTHSLANDIHSNGMRRTCKVAS